MHESGLFSPPFWAAAGTDGQHVPLPPVCKHWSLDYEFIFPTFLYNGSKPVFMIPFPLKIIDINTGVY